MDHIYIRAWHKFIHGDDTTGLAELIELADATECPEDAVFYNDDTKTWTCFKDITNSVTLRMLDPIYRELAGLPPVKGKSKSKWF